jgi:hypothetical protein
MKCCILEYSIRRRLIRQRFVDVIMFVLVHVCYDIPGASRQSHSARV